LTEINLSVENGFKAVFSSEGVPIFFKHASSAWSMATVINEFNDDFIKDSLIIPFQSWEDMNERRF
jgi:hypothetical protein